MTALLARLAEDQPFRPMTYDVPEPALVDDPPSESHAARAGESGRSEPRPAPLPEGFDHHMVLTGLPSGEIRVGCTCGEKRTYDAGHTPEDYMEMKRQHAGLTDLPGPAEDGATSPDQATSARGRAGEPGSQRCFWCGADFTELHLGTGGVNWYCKAIEQCIARQQAALAEKAAAKS